MKKIIPFLLILTLIILLIIGYLTYVFSNRNRISIDLLIKNGTILTIDSKLSILKNASIAINNSKIIAIDSDKKLLKDFNPKKIINAENKLIMPGLINTHTHAAMVLFRGIKDDVDLNTWLQNYIWPNEKANINPETVYFATSLAILEMIHSGTTFFNDMYFFEDEVAKAAKRIGIRAIIGEGILDFPTPSQANPDEALNYSENLINKYQNDPLIMVAIAPHSPYTCSTDTLLKAKRLAVKYNVPFHIHVAETKEEVNTTNVKYGLTPVKYLDSLGIIDTKLISAHSVWLTEEEIALLAKKQGGIAHDPESNEKLADGVAPIPQLLAAGAKIGLGTDGAASNNNLNLVEEIDTAAKLHKVVSLNPTVMKAEDLVKMATIGGAQILGVDHDLGSIEVGKKADLLIIDLNKPNLIPVYNYYSMIAYNLNASDIETVIINGKIIMFNHKIKTINEQTVINDFKRIIKEKTNLTPLL